MNRCPRCPRCNGPLQELRVRTWRERFITVFSLYRAYYCFECPWRGWLRKNTKVIQRGVNVYPRLVRYSPKIRHSLIRNP